jgi:16S rRNA (cytosine967-C5)-methyltransferase
MEPDAVALQCDGDNHAPAALTDREREGLTKPLTDAPPHVQADVPEWLWPSFQRAFGARAIVEGRKLAERAAAGVRVNTLKATREKAVKALTEYGAVEAALSPVGVIVPAPTGAARTPNLEAEAAFQAGWCEIQDEGSQIAALLVGAGPRMQVLDLCAGAGGKTLAMAAGMQNTGQIFAYDEDRVRLKPIFDRLKRAGVRNAQVLRGGDRKALLALGPKFDAVLVDAPCTGTGVWRRRPDSKWRLRVKSLADRQEEQLAVLRTARDLVKPGGRLTYVTCSVLPEENGDTLAAFLAEAPDMKIVPYGEVWSAQFATEPPASADGRLDTLQLTPAAHGTDGFFIAILTKS